MKTLWQIAKATDEHLGAYASGAGLTLEQAVALREIMGYLRSCAAHPHSQAWARVFAARDAFRAPAAPTPKPAMPFDGGPLGETTVARDVPRSPATPFSGKLRTPPARSSLEPLAALGQTAPVANRSAGPALPFGDEPQAQPPSAVPEPPRVPRPGAVSLPSAQTPPISAAPPSAAPPQAPSLQSAAPQPAAPQSPPPQSPPLEAAPPPQAVSAKPTGPSFGPELIAERMRGAGASEADVAAFVAALQPPPPDDDGDDDLGR